MWRLLLIELIVVLVVAAIWLLGPLVGLKSVLARLGVIAVLLLPPIAYLIVKLLQRKRDAEGLENALAEQGQGDEQNARPDRREEISQLRDQFGEAIGALRASKLGKGSALYALPWYMIIGPPGAGKSTALQASGLNFPYTTGDKAIQGVGGTRNCDWWFSDEAILLDTAGRYTLEEQDRDEWLAFLRLVKRYRSKQPLNGLIVCVSIADLVANPPEQNLAIAKQVRKRVDELLKELELMVPVYVVMSKCDLLAGFSESFGQMKRSTRGQVLGFTVPLTDAKTDLEQLVETEFDTLVATLRKRSLAQLAVADGAQRPGIYGFPLQFESAKEPLSAFIKQLFAADPYRETPRLRGIYFCSGTQEGQPIDRVIARMGESLGLPAVTQQRQQEQQKKSYFLRDVFTKVMFPDQHIATTSKSGLSRRFRAEIIGLVAGVLVAAGVIGLSTMTYSNNSSLLSSSVALAKKARAGEVEDPQKLIASLRALKKLAQRIADVDKYTADVPLSLGLGYYSGRKLSVPLRKIFAKQMKRLFVDPVGSEIEATLADVVNPSSGSSNVVKDYELLKIYIMITTPKHLDTKFAGLRLVELWKKRLNPTVAKESDLLTSLAGTYLGLIKAGHARWLSPDSDTIRDARRALRKRDVDYQRLVANVSQDLVPLTLRNLLGRIQTVLKARTTVPGIYTRRGWKLHMAKRLSGKPVEPWVLGESGSAKDITAKLRKRYFENYISAWRRFIGGLSLQRTSNIKEGLKLIKTLTDSPPLYKKVFQAIAYQTKLAMDVGSGVGKATKALAKKAGAAGKLLKSASGKLGRKAQGKVKLTAVGKAFKPLHVLVNPPPGPDGKPQVAGLSQYLDKLNAVKVAMIKFVANTEKPDPGPLNEALGDARRVTTAVLSPLPSGLRAQLGALMFQPLLGAASQAKNARAALTGSSFTTEVCEAFDEKLKGRYPFARSGRDALLQDAADFFSPGGTAWGFYNNSLKSQLLRKGDHFKVAKGTKLAGNIVYFYRRAWIVTRALFSRGSAKPGLRFEARPQPVITAPGSGYQVSQVTLELGPQKHTYRNGPVETWTYTWPKGDNAARLIVRGRGGLREEIATSGDWALMKLIDKADKRKRAPWYQVTWKLKGGKIKIRIDFRPSRTHNPLFERLKLRCR